MKKSSILGTAAIMATAALISTAAHATPTGAEFVQKATIGNLFEIQSSQTALKMSQNDQVKKFAQHMIDDHTKAGDQLKATLSTANVDPSTVPTALDAPHQKIEDKLTAEKPADFDKAYIKAQAKAHDETIDLFKSYAAKGDNAALKTFAAQTLPTLEEHKTEVAKLKAEGSADKAMSSMSSMSATAPAAGSVTPATDATAPK